MPKKLVIDSEDKIPVYKQLISQVRSNISDGTYPDGYLLPSMNSLSAELDISKETVKKSYSVLRSMGFIEAKQGKGYYVCSHSPNSKVSVLLLFDKLSNYKQILYDSLIAKLGSSAEITIRLHSQNLDLFEYYLNENLDLYDYYVITPHFPLDKECQKRTLKLLKRVPYSKLIMVDRMVPEMTGNFGVVYQDFNNDIVDGLKEGLSTFRKYQKMNVVTMPSSLYAGSIKTGVDKFCKDYGIAVEYFTEISPEMIHKDEVYLMLNSQLDFGLIKLIKLAREHSLRIGKDIGLISYNESPINEIILNGLTSVSTDFSEMGEKVAEMILSKNLTKFRCGFHMIRRSTF